MAQGGSAGLPAAARHLVELVEAAADGLTLDELTAAARRKFAGLHVRRVADLAGRAVAAGLLTVNSGRFRNALSAPEMRTNSLPTPAAASGGDRGIRAVVLDLESIVRTTAAEPYTDKRIFQIGALRAGTDRAWAADEASFNRFVALPDDTWQIRSGRVRERHASEAVPAADALLALHAYCVGADMIVTYNGTEADFPMLAEAYEREGLPTLEPAQADAYYLALAMWPTASTHRLALLADELGVDRGGLGWHDAVDDCVLLSRLLDRAAETLIGWDRRLVDLLSSVCPDSLTWTLVRHLAGASRGQPAGQPLGVVSPLGTATVAAILGSHLAGHSPRRSPGAAAPPTRAAVRVGDDLRGPDGRVDPVRLAAVVHGGEARRRPAQEEMASALHRWADAGVPALVEAPTGTGKSFAVLAAALDWLHGGRERTAIITTFTKQLQAQLAADVARLDDVVPGLLDTTDVVKGQSNRLSLRALTVVLADATAASSAGWSRLGLRNRFLDRPVFRELVVFLTLRLLAATDVLASWAAHSVDPVDVPAFFTGYAGTVLPVWLESLSQASNGEYAVTAAVPLAAHTDAVREALASHRLLLANHALLLAHLDDLGVLGRDTLLIIDEAHQLEDAATSALTTGVDYRAVEDLHAELAAWVGTCRRGPGWGAVNEAVGNLHALLDHEQLPRVAGRAFDARGTGTGVVVGSRTVALASPYGGSAGVGEVRQLAGLLLRLGGQCEALVGTIGAYQGSHAPTMDFFELERVRGLLVRCAELRDSARALVADMDTIVGPVTSLPPAAAADPTSTMPDRDGDTDSGGDGDGDGDGGGGGDGGWAALGALPPGTSNRVVYAEELNPLKGGLRRYQFRIASSPVELPADTTWQGFLGTFVRTYYVSATLRAAGRWDFIRTRLGLSDSVRTLDLDTPFDLASQAELVCLSDFPSWAEQSDGAMRTVAHQLAGYSREMVRSVSAETGAGDGIADAGHGDHGGFDGGALVLTTARSTAGGIADYLATELRHRGDAAAVYSALVLGNPQAVRQFTDLEHGGGFCVGTKGLWQGVDVADERRVRLVWINKLPFAPFAAPVTEARREAVRWRAEAAHAEDPDAVATETYYLPLAALQLRQAVGRLIRSERHRGVVIISDRKLAGQTALRRAYRQTFLGSLDSDLLRPDPVTGERAGGNVLPMAAAWARIWAFFAAHDLLPPDRAAALCTAEALEEHTLLPQTRRIRTLTMTSEEVVAHRAAGTLEEEVLDRAATIGGLLRLSDEPATLKLSQQEVIRAVAGGQNVLGLLPTGFGKSFCFQLPALVLPGVTLVVSPLVALMHDQALELNRSIGGAVRALVAPLRESSSRAGKTEVADQLLGRADHGIRMVYVSPERLCQRRFRELVRSAVRAGTVTRIALDEAHTVVQWDDFRPAMSRVERFLAELRADHALPVTALTATANRTVLVGLREGVFGLPPEAPGGPAGESAEAASGTLLTVRENPIRPELAIFRRTMGKVGPSINAGLAEEVRAALDGHAIFYCLTVKEVVALHAHLRDYLGEGGARVRRFHGRLTEVEKSAVMTEFREAPRKGEEGFAPLVVVATSAFGLGINRPDVRTVFCVSAPTDLAALYQQIGRAGRDAAGTTVIDGDANVGLALLTTRGLRTVAFMTGSDLRPSLLAGMGRAVLACRSVLDATEIADDLIGADLAAGYLTADDVRKSRTAEEYQAGVMRAFAALAALGAVDDLGDFPPFCTAKAGELLGAVPAMPASREDGSRNDDAVEDAVVRAVLELPVRDVRSGALRRGNLDVARLDTYLAGRVRAFRTLAEDPAGTWQLLADLHDRGLLDISAAPSRHLVTGLRAQAHTVPAGFTAEVSGKAARAAEEVRLLRDFFDDSTTCANRKLADYFGVANLPEGCCSHSGNRCSACWNTPTWPPGDVKPPGAVALETPRPRPAGMGLDAAHRQRRLDEQVAKLVWEVFAGVRAADLHHALRGEDSRYNPATRRRVRLRSGLVSSRYFGANPAVRLSDVEDSLARLAAEGRVVGSGPRWRDTGHVRREAARAAKAASLATVAPGTLATLAEAGA